MRRVNCRRCGIVAVEEVPWGDGKRTLTEAYMLFLARWARRLSWKETAAVFHTSWDKVFDAVEHAVTFGLEHRVLGKIDAIGVDEIQYALGVMNAPLRAQTDWQAAAGGKMSFDVASIKPVTPEAVAYPPFPLDDGNAFTQTGGRFRAIFPLPAFIYFAYKVGPTPGQRQAMLAHLPKWVDSDRFLIEARAPSNTTKDQFRLMMQTLLADRFKLAVRFESRKAPVYALSLIKAGKLGPNLRRHSEGPACPAAANIDSPLADAKVFPSICEMYMFERMPDHMRGRWGGRNITMASLAGALAHVPFAGAPVDRPTVDKTGLNGTFDFKVEYAPQPLTPTAGALQRPGEAPRAAVNEVEPDLNGPTFLNGLREQLGLKLTPAKGQVQILIIDHVVRPSEIDPGR